MNDEIKKKVTEMLDQLRVHLQNDGGDLELVKIEDWKVFLKLKGACGCCPHAQMTLKNGIEAILREQIDEKITVERAS